MTIKPNDQTVALYPSTAGNNLPSTDFRESIPDAFEEEIHLRDYIEVMLRRKWIVIGALFLTFVSVLIFSLAAQKQYLANGTVELSMESQKLTKFEDMDAETVRAQEFVATQVSLLKSNTIADRVIQGLNLKEDPVFVGDIQKDSDDPGIIAKFKTAIRSFFQKEGDNQQDNKLITETIENNMVMTLFLDNLTVSPRRDSMIVDVSFLSPSRQLSQDVVNRLMTEFIKWKMDQKVTSSGTAREYLMKQIDRAKINLEDSEEKQNQFARKAGIVSMDSRLNSVFKQLEDINVALGQAEGEFISKETLYKQAEKDGPESLPQVLTSTLINDLKTEYAKNRSEYEQLSETFRDDYPDVKTIKARMTSIEGRINSESQKIFNSIEYDQTSR